MRAIFFLISLSTSGVVLAESYKQTPDCVFAMVTKKTGFASGLAHNHFVSHSLPNVKMETTAKSINNVKFVGNFMVTDLEFDDFLKASRWQGRLKEIGVLSEEFRELTRKERETVKSHALASDQLNAEKHSIGKVLLKSIREGAPASFDKFKYTATADVTLNGVTVEIAMAANVYFSNETVQFESVATSKFTDFKIEPYSAFLGAVGNEDQFYIYTNCKATLESQ